MDALGTTTTYEAYLSREFPGIEFTVTSKADSKFKIVGAASVAAKVTRDACMEGWVFEEASNATNTAADANTDEDLNLEDTIWTTELGSGYPSGTPPFQTFLSQSIF